MELCLFIFFAFVAGNISCVKRCKLRRFEKPRCFQHVLVPLSFSVDHLLVTRVDFSIEFEGRNLIVIVAVDFIVVLTSSGGPCCHLASLRVLQFAAGQSLSDNKSEEDNNKRLR